MPTGDFLPIVTPRHRRRSNAETRVLIPGARVVDPAVLQWARDLGICEWCGTPCGPDPSHAKSVGSGGDDSFENVSASCRRCHDSHHQGHEPTTDQLLMTAARREQFGRARAAFLALRSPAMWQFSSGPGGTGSGGRRPIG